MLRLKPSSALNVSSATASRPAGFSSVSPSAPASSGSPTAAKNGPLGINGSYVDNGRRSSSRLASFASKRCAANLLLKHDEKWAGRVSACGYVAHQPAVELQWREHAGGEVSGSLFGLVSCKSVWACPVCSARISNVRRDEMNTLLAWSREQGHAVVMLTLTARHNSKTALAPFLDDLKEAARRLRQSRAFRGLGLIGSVAATEVTHGRNGWHPHLHLLLVVPLAPADALSAVELLRDEWSRSLVKFGRDCNAAGFQVQAASAAGDYVAKFGAGEELALGNVKLGRGGSRSPWQLLSDATAGDKRACALWVEFALAFKGRRQLQWSNGLKLLCGVGEVSDDQAADAEPASEPVTLRAWSGSSPLWRSARRRRCALLDAAETGSSLDAAEYGPTDAERWRGELAAAVVIE